MLTIAYVAWLWQQFLDQGLSMMPHVTSCTDTTHELNKNNDKRGYTLTIDVPRPINQLFCAMRRWDQQFKSSSFMVRDTIHDDIDISSMWRVSSSQRPRKHYQICCKGCRPQKTVQSSYLHGKCCKFGYFFRHLSFVRVILSIAAVARGPSKLQNDTHKTRIHSMKLYFNRNR